MAHAYGALRHLGFGETESKRALIEVASRVGREADLQTIVHAALALLTS